MEQPRFILQPYKGPATRHTCPQCRKPKEFARYLDTETGELLPDDVGKCNRADACGYHFPPREYFRTNGIRPVEVEGRERKEEAPPRPPYLHDRSEVVALRAFPEKNNLSAYWRERIGAERWDGVAKSYALGTWMEGDLAGAAVYWQVDALGKVKAGKIMQYDPQTGKRRKDGRATSFVHFERTGRNASDLNVEQSLYGEHLLKSWPIDATVAVLESEKSCLIAAALVPSILWLAVGSLGSFGLGKLQALAGRKLLAFPDLSKDGTAYRKWKEVSYQIGHLFSALHVSDLLERIATDEDREAGFDIGDYLLRQGTGPEVTAPAPVKAPPSMAERITAEVTRWNPAIASLITACDMDMDRARITHITA